MTFTGTLIEDLMATVERAEQRAQLDRACRVDPILVTTSIAESCGGPWFAAVQNNTEYDPKFLGVA